MKRQLFQGIWRHILFKAGKKPLSPLPSLYWHSRMKGYGTRLTSTYSEYNIGHMKIQQTYLEICTPSWPQFLKLNYIWLRDHCRCNTCYNHTTNQRNCDILDIPLNIQPQSSAIEGDKLIITWPDGHKSEYLLDWLWKNSYNGLQNSNTYHPKLWNRQSVELKNIAQVDMCQYMNTYAGVYDVVKSIVDFGVGIVKNVPATTEATEKVVQQIAHIQQTMFGGMWEFSDHLDHCDTAYTRQALGAHSDNTYFTEAAGLQVFHCLHHDGEGGETLLVDGFRAAYDLKQTHPKSFQRLSTLPIEAEYLEAGKHYTNVDSMLKLHPLTKKLQQIRFNLNDRAPMRILPADQIPQLYEDIHLLAAKVKDPEGEWWLKLHPGTVLFIDNWRVLHGRASYTGHRKMTGCYISRADYMSKAKVLEII